MPVPVLQVPAVEEGGPGGFPNLLRVGGWGGWGGREGGWWWIVGDGGELELRYSRGHPGGHNGLILLGPLCHVSPSPAPPASRFFSPRRS